MKFVLVLQLFFTGLMLPKSYAANISEPFILSNLATYAPEVQSVRSPVVILVAGAFPNGCYKWAGAKVKNLFDHRHEITSYAIVEEGMCTMAIVPFIEKVEIGMLGIGIHKFRFINADGTYFQKNIEIVE
ncbi:MAG: hypothetical protein V4736_03495 [Bdellovibrionota bacterium]